MNKLRTKRISTLAGLSLAAGLFGCMDDSGVSVSSHPSSQRGSEFDREVSELKKSTRPENYDAALEKVQEKYGIVPQATLPANKLPSNFLISEKPGITPVPSSAKVGLTKTSGTINSGSYTPAVTYLEVIYLNAGDSVEFYTSNGSSGVDPVLVLFQITNQQGNDFISTGIIEQDALGINYINTYNDDYGSLHSKVQYQAISGEHYALQAFPYSSSSTGTVTLTKRIKHGGTWTTTSSTISIAGSIYRYSGSSYGSSYAEATSVSGGADPWVWVWSFSVFNNCQSGCAAGVHNDDWWGNPGTRDSQTANTSVFPLSQNDHPLNCVIYSGYSNGGTATWRHYN